MVTKSTLGAGPNRDRASTEKRILAALHDLVVDEGIQALGVNRIARVAETDKVLIYRYFGDLEGLFAAYAEASDFWWTVDDLVGGNQPGPEEDSLAGWFKLILRRHAGALRDRPVTLRLLAAETSMRNGLTIALEEVRERRALELMVWVEARFGRDHGLDLAAASAVLGAAINYLALRSTNIARFNGVDLTREEDWDRLFATMDRMVEGVCAA